MYINSCKLVSDLVYKTICVYLLMHIGCIYIHNRCIQIYLFNNSIQQIFIQCSLYAGVCVCVCVCADIEEYVFVHK